MKKLNRKGFTLVELLAVIIILAIVVGITIPAVLTTTSKAKQKAFQTAASSMADWFDRQYQVASTELDDTGLATLDSNFAAYCGANGNNQNCVGESSVITATKNKKLIEAAGVKPTNVEYIGVTFNPQTGRSCVRLVANKTGDYQTSTGNTPNVAIGGICDDRYYVAGGVRLSSLIFVMVKNGELIKNATPQSGWTFNADGVCTSCLNWGGATIVD